MGHRAEITHAINKLCFNIKIKKGLSILKFNLITILTWMTLQETMELNQS